MATEPDEGSTGDSEDAAAESEGSGADSSAGEATAGTSTDEESTDEAPLSGTVEESDEDEFEEDSEEPFSDFTRSVIVTTCATLLGMAAGIASMLFATAEAGSTADPDNLLGIAILVGAVFVQFPLYSLLGMDPEEFGTKTQLYIFAMTFFMWFITWTILLTTGGLL